MKRYNKVMVCISFLLAGALVGCPQKDIGNTSTVASAIISNGTSQTNQSTENAEQTESIIHESADILYYDNSIGTIPEATIEAVNALKEVDTLIIGGGMAYTFFKAQGYEVGNSLCELDKLDLAKELMEKAKEKGVKLMLPVDTKVGKEFKPDTESKTVPWTEIPADWEGFDIGEKSINPEKSQYYEYSADQKVIDHFKTLIENKFYSLMLHY